MCDVEDLQTRATQLLAVVSSGAIQESTGADIADLSYGVEDIGEGAGGAVALVEPGSGSWTFALIGCGVQGRCAQAGAAASGDVEPTGEGAVGGIGCEV